MAALERRREALEETRLMLEASMLYEKEGGEGGRRRGGRKEEGRQRRNGKGRKEEGREGGRGKGGLWYFVMSLPPLPSPQLSWGPDSKQVLTASGDKTCKLWDVTTLQVVW